MKCIGITRIQLLVLALSGLFLVACGVKTKDTSARYVTWDGLEPDKWASIWLIKRHIDPDAEIVLRPAGAPIEYEVAFGVPGARYVRVHGKSVYDSLYAGNALENPALGELGNIIRDIEITPWGTKSSKHSSTVELAFRGLQDAYDARNVPVDCYGRFFDEVYSLLSDAEGNADWSSLDRLAHRDPACLQSEGTLARRDLAPFVRRLQTHVVLDHIAADRKVVFVDVREPAEYDEFHIPGAVNIALRELDPDIKDRFEGADLVIPYCIKDFRGFEMARSLAELGVDNVGIMQPYGIAGWRHAGLPIASRDGLTESEALDKLTQCARAGNCLTGTLPEKG
jgi:rhodanese-related sulfurtransferase